MLFSSYDFLFMFLPAAVAGFYFLGIVGGTTAAFYWLLLSSFFFYGWWSPTFLALLIVSCIINAFLGTLLVRGRGTHRIRLLVVTSGIVFNLGALTYFKYAGFIASNIDAAVGSHIDLGKIVLPLGISFFTFQKIAFLVDAYRGEVATFSIRRFFLFVFFFPQLIAGPIVHHREIMPQLNDRLGTRIDYEAIATGLTIFIIGLFKKTVIADGIAPFANAVFQAADSGVQVNLIDAWTGTLAYSFQLYFDFSGYSDMAIGLALMFGLRLPINFESPYKASSLIDFWRCWHITLSRFLRDYLYIPLGGGRRGTPRRLVNVLLVMMIGGFWHGANWTFLAWGTIHGVGLVLNHWYRQVRGVTAWQPNIWLGRVVTFAFVSLAWIPFRAADIASAWRVFRGVIGLNGVLLPESYLPKLGFIGMWAAAHGISFQGVYYFQGMREVVWLLVLLGIVWYFPNTSEWARYSLAIEDVRTKAVSWFSWRPTFYWATAVTICALVALVFVGRGGEFLYFQF